MTNPLIVYDLDGTLLDTAPDLMDSLDQAIASQGLAPVDRSIMRSHVGFGSQVMITKAFELADEHLNESVLDRLVDDLVNHYLVNMPGKTEPFDGLLESMNALKAEGCRFAVCTNKREGPAKKLLETLDLADSFAVIAGADTYTVRKPHPDHLLNVISDAGAQKQDSIMVGDTPTDFSTAQAAKVPVIAVDFGYCAEPVQTYEPDVVISHYRELDWALVERLLGPSS